jgi:biotin transport system substrate-specific component
MEIEKIRQMVLSCLMASLAAVGAYLLVPLGPVPVTLTTLFVLLAGLLLGSRQGLASMGLYLLVGLIGLPVFSGGRGGIGHLLGPTGGYLAGFCLAAWVTGFISERTRGHLAGQVLAVAAGSLSVYAVGLPWLRTVANLSWSQALFAGMAPFLPGDAAKALAALALARAIRPILSRQLAPSARPADGS